MDDEVLNEIAGAIEDAMHMNVETAARLMLLCELLVEKGYLKDTEVMHQLSQSEVDKLLAESGDGDEAN